MLTSLVQQHLIELQFQLKRLNMWTDTMPSNQALNSCAPFACDMMSFENWLQFIFTPKMEDLITNQQPLPNQIALTPVAEHCWGSVEGTQALMTTVENLDKLLNAAG